MRDIWVYDLFCQLLIFASGLFCIAEFSLNVNRKIIIPTLAEDQLTLKLLDLSGTWLTYKRYSI